MCKDGKAADNTAQVSAVKQVTGNRFLNYFELEAKNRKGGSFPYYMASRALSPEELFMNAPEKGPDGVTIFCVYGPDHGKVVLVRQYRYAVGGYVYEFPAGLVEHGEDIHEAAVREVKEETGLTLNVVRPDPMHERAFFMTDGMTDERCAFVYGYCEGEPSQEGLEDTESIQVVIADREEVRRILSGELVAASCAYMLMHFLHTDEPFSFLEIKDE